MDSKAVRFQLIGVALILLLVPACERGNTTTSSPVNAESKLIAKVGTFSVGNGGFIIRVFLRPGTKSVVDFVVEPVSDQRAILSGSAGSDAMRWFLFWATENGQLWVYSGDEGVFLWHLDSSGKYTRSSVTPEDLHLVKAMPQIFFDALPSSLRSEWAGQRNNP